MRATMTSVAGHAERSNEDFTGVVPTGAVLIDGAGIPGGEVICRHGVAWYAHRLGGALLAPLSLEPDRSLRDLLGEAIEQVTDRHRHTCDVANPISPSAAVALMRCHDGFLDHLVLGDATLVLEQRSGDTLVATDPREPVISAPFEPLLAAVPAGSAQYRDLLRELRGHRNRPGGFWVAKDDPRAADEAITGRTPVAEVNSAVLLSNGASRIVDAFHLTDWPGVLTVLATSGPEEVIRQVRQAEARDGVALDDATITHCTDLV
jgi:hypothetical protein